MNRLHDIQLQFIYTTGIPMGVANYVIMYDFIGQCYYTHMYMVAVKSVDGSLNSYNSRLHVLSLPGRTGTLLGLSCLSLFC